VTNVTKCEILALDRQNFVSRFGLFVELSFAGDEGRLQSEMAQMKITLKLFGSLREAAAESTLQVELEEGSSVADLRNWLSRRNPLVDKLGDRLAASINLEIAVSDAILQEGDEVAFLPPVAGGDGTRAVQDEVMTKRCTISDQQLDEAEVISRVDGPDAGGIVSFVGNVRNHARGHTIEHLEYEVYPEMAEREMEKIADEASDQWPGTRVAIAHRVGRLEIGEAAVVVVAASAHRDAAFLACRFAIDTLKLRVPIWKREVATDGAYWVDDHA